MTTTTGTAAQEAKNQFFNALWRSRTYRSLAKVYGDDIATNACEDQFDNYTDRNERPTQVGVVAYAKSHLEATR